MKEKLKIDFAIRDPQTDTKIMKGKGELEETISDIVKKFNLESKIGQKIKRKGAWYD